MAQSLVSPELETFAEDLLLSTGVEVYYLDSQGAQRMVSYCGYSTGEEIRIELRPHLVVRTSVQDVSEADGWRTETVEIPLERVLLSKVLEPDRWNEMSNEDLQRALWVTDPQGKLLRLHR